MALPVGVGSAEEQQAFLQEHARFIARYPFLNTVVEKALCRPLASPPQPEVDRLKGRCHDDLGVIALEDRTTTDRVVFFLGRIAADDFGEILILSGNGRGIGAYKVLRGMYERVVHAVYFDQNEWASRLLVRKSHVDKAKLATRLLEFGIDLLADYSDQDRVDLERRATDAKNDKRLLNLVDMAQKSGQRLKELYGPCYLEPTIHHHANAFGMERRLLRQPGGGFTYNEGSYRPQVRNVLCLGHNMLLQNLHLQNNHFNLGLEGEVQKCFDAFTEIWGNRSTSNDRD